MKVFLYVVTILTACISCGGSASQQEQTQSEEIVAEDSFVDADLIAKVQGEHYIIKNSDDHIHYQEPCGVATYDLKISETAEYSGEWSLEWDGEDYDIENIEQKGGDIYITSSGDEFTFLFEKNEIEHSWNFMEIGMDAIHLVANVVDIDHFDTKPCTDIDAILNSLSHSWYELTDVEGKEVIYMPCAEAPSGFDFVDGGYDNRSGDDPQPIVTMSKSKNSITMTYRHVFAESTDSLTMTLMYDGNLIEIGERRYVSKTSKDDYPTVEEECG